MRMYSWYITSMLYVRRIIPTYQILPCVQVAILGICTHIWHSNLVQGCLHTLRTPLYVSKKDPPDTELGMQMYNYIHTTTNRNLGSSGYICRR